ncbi:imidazoleglycerol-phosphate dehydratase HisB [Venenivibrio stagnispumantis]|uniref:Imidazoleglycerol-phosphate dehydratase n=1 Tax=Venenivibrio stagnispumantis TaxID=407998 RepID=A0AA46ACK0_9AQUI|nr:imidazoleglycerol-phosphate dehydratase HisB [Venenivibrio stagnispumantis]MCW4572735.1 imidazoleglycerol-phosphate dehydratase HisB [Venenivibrio stagnispumantis]SMP00213.1 imidazoleglycerol-phosphate dehydratase [Venenivibrio stagnispumantis]
MERKATIKRETKETQIELSLNLDGTGKHLIDTQIGFLSHMLESFSYHSMIDLEIMATGDIHVSHHHLVEDVGIVLGSAIKEALGDKKGIKRFGYAIIPMDEALVLSSIDLSGRPLLFYDDNKLRGKITNFDFELMGEFFKGLVLSLNATVHLKMLAGHNLHHIAECFVKAFAISLKEAISVDERRKGIPSTKGSL